MTGSWHAGEVAVQARAGVAERMAEVGPRVLRDHLIGQHRDFYPLLPFVVLGVVDGKDDVWATLRAGPPGFMSAPDEHRLQVRMAPQPDDPAEDGMGDGAALGLLGIELATRRRNRLNGRMTRTADGFELSVRHSYGNCPKYIQTRDITFVRDPESPPAQPPQVLDRLDAAARAAIFRADMLFVASYADTAQGRQVDVSHRGGRIGFVRLDGDSLIVPEYAGNFFFNTLGNFAVNPKAGLVFPDFTTGDLLQMTGDVELDSAPVGPPRFWRFTPRRIMRRCDALPLRATFGEWSPHLPAIWPAA